VPARPSDLPNYYERIALQKLAKGSELSAAQLAPAGRQTIAKLLEKGWIQHGDAARLYRITKAGDAAMRAELPTSSRRRAAS
jgi:hypothetical protein